MQFLLLLCGLVGCIHGAWLPAAEPNAYSSIFVPSDEANVFPPINGDYMLYEIPFNAPNVEFCVNADKKAQDCVQYFCNSTVRANATYHTLMHNYCTYCLVGNRTQEQFVLFHQTIQQDACPLYTRFNSSLICGQGNRAWMHPLLLNISRPIPPFICYCPSMDQFGFRCDGWTTYIPIHYVGYTGFIMSLAFLLLVVLVVFILLPECGLRCKKFRKVANKRKYEHWSEFFEIRMQSIFLAFFWAFFHSSLAPTVEIGAIWPPKGIEVLNPWEIPFFKYCAFTFFWSICDMGSSCHFSWKS
jgi:hypothetical protein